MTPTGSLFLRGRDRWTEKCEREDELTKTLTGVWVFTCTFFCILTGYCAEDKRGCLTLDGKNVVSLGTYPSADDRMATVKILNTGDGVVQITRVVTTCSCMRVDNYPRTLGPGESGEVSVSIRKNELIGAFERVFYIESDDPRNRRVRIRIEGNAQPLFLVTCITNTVLGQIESGLVWTGKYTVAATATGLSLGTATMQNRGTRCEYSIRTNMLKKIVYEVARTVTFEGEGPLESVLQLPVIRQGATEPLPIRLAVTANRRRSLRVVPDRLSFSRGGAQIKHRVLVSVDSSGPVEMGLLSCRADLEGMAFNAIPAANHKMFFVDLTFSADYVARLVSVGEDKIRINYGDRDQAEIPVSLMK